MFVVQEMKVVSKLAREAWRSEGADSGKMLKIEEMAPKYYEESKQPDYQRRCYQLKF